MTIPIRIHAADHKGKGYMARFSCLISAPSLCFCFRSAFPSFLSLLRFSFSLSLRCFCTLREEARGERVSVPPSSRPFNLRLLTFGSLRCQRYLRSQTTTRAGAARFSTNRTRPFFPPLTQHPPSAIRALSR